MPAAKGNDYALKRKVNPQYTQQQIKKIADDLLEWAHQGKGIYIASYVYATYKKHKSWLYDLAEHHPEIKEALAQAKDLIGGKITNHCFEGDKNSTFGEKILPIYSADYKALLKWKAELAKLSQSETSLTAADLIKAAEAGKLLDLLKQKD